MPVDNTEPLSVYRAGPGYSRCLAGMILLATRGHLVRGIVDEILDLPEERSLDVLAALAMHPGQLWGRIDNAYVALVDGVCSGMLTVRPARNLEGFVFNEDAFCDVASRLGIAQAEAQAIIGRKRLLEERFDIWTDTFDEGVWMLEYLAVRRENRAGGVARGLLERMLNDVSAAGGVAVELYCDMGNAHAERLYASQGFTQVYEFLFPEDLSRLGIGVRRLRLELDGSPFATR